MNSMVAEISTAYLARVLDMNRERFLYGLDRVPEDRLAWSPGGSSRSPLELAGRLAAFLEHRSRILESEPGVPVARSLAPAPESREEARRRVAEGFSRLTATVEALPGADLERPV